jgi:hypothetical protein
MNEITVKEETMESALIAIVQNKDIDPERLEKFIDMQFRLEDRQAEKALNVALTDFQVECPIINKMKKGHNSKYAPLDEIVFKIKDLLNKHGLSYSFNTQKINEIETNIITTIRHRGGAKFDSTYTFKSLDDGGRMNTSQQKRSANTYAKRTGLENALGIVTQDEDDDATRAVDSLITQDQVLEIEDMIESMDLKKEAILSHFKISKFEESDALLAKKIISQLKMKRAR